MRQPLYAFLAGSMSNVGACPIKNSLMKRSFHRELLKLNFRIALSNDKRLTEKISASLLL